MSEGESVRSFRSWLRTPAGVSVFLLSILVFLYSFLVQGTLAFVWLVIAAWLLWLAYRLVRAFERIADAQQRQATLREREADFERELLED